MKYYFHGTPSSRVPQILREGLRLGSPTSLTPSGLLGMAKGKIYLWDSLENAIYYLTPEVPDEVEPLTILRIELPSGYPIYEEASDVYYTTRSIPARCIETVKLNM